MGSAIKFYFLFLLTILLFQNCSKVQYEFSENFASQMFGLVSYNTKEDSLLNASIPKTAQEFWGPESKIEILSTPKNGVITSFDESTGEFTYQPQSNFNGSDEFIFSEKLPTKTVERTAIIKVTPENDLPWIETNSLGFKFNTQNNDISLILGDIDNSPETLSVQLIKNTALYEGQTVQTQKGILRVNNGTIKYTPNSNFRGTDKYTFFVKDPDGGINEKEILLAVGNPLFDIEPAMAVRGVGCISCHAKLDSTLITDFGLGSPYFFNKNPSSGVIKPFQGFYGDHSFSWLTTEFKNNKVIIPSSNTQIGTDLSTPSHWQKADGSKLRDLPDSFFQGLSVIKTLSQYITYLELQRPNLPLTPAQKVGAEIIHKQTVNIRAPTELELKGKWGQPTTNIKYLPNSDNEHQLSGLQWVNNNNLTYLTNVANNSGAAVKIRCDGDLYINGTVFLKDPEVETVEGCRIYATGPIFMQGQLRYHNLSNSGDNKTNLQLVSTQMISLGVGVQHCESSTNVGWYYNNPASDQSPARKRFQYPGQYTRSNINGESLYTIATSILHLQDASCHGRNLSFERLLLNAPMVHSRYTGKFTGVLVAEVALFSLSHFAFKFDPVFKTVPILPVLPPEYFLDVH